jgi:uncharacterized protein (TIGR00290 family)
LRLFAPAEPDICNAPFKARQPLFKMDKPKAIFCWSGGKDSSLALYRVLREQSFSVVALLTTLNQNHQRISMHGIRENLLDLQAAATGIPLHKAWVSGGSNEEYEKKMEEALLFFKEQGITHIIYGDIFLEDLRAYREKNLAKLGLQAVFPLWKEDTTKLMDEFLREGFETITCCVSTRSLDESFAGRVITAEFIRELPAGVDVCGENGEFHTFCYKGPVFHKQIPFSIGEKVFRPVTEFVVEGKDGFWFTDLLIAEK